VAALANLFSAALRGVIVAPPGKRLLVGDLSNIEGRVVAWLAGEEWKLRAFSDFDAGAGPDIYCLAYSKLFGVTPEAVTKSQRQVGKVVELMLGYGGGVGAFITGAETYRINLEEMAAHAWPLMPRDVQLEAEKFWWWSEEESKTFGLTHDVFVACDGIKRLWRRAHPKIVQFWADAEHAVRVVIEHGTPALAGRLEFDKVGAWLRMKLPSGGYLSYPAPRIEGGKITFLGMSPYSRKWARQPTWGGTLVENATQATARDVLAVGLLRAEGIGLNPVLHVHDEIICEVAGIQPEVLKLEMEAGENWTQGLPLAAKVFATDRYRKGD